jgi:hypothetical protein
VEFSRDVEFPTTSVAAANHRQRPPGGASSRGGESERQQLHNTTQETVAAFLAMAPRDVCVVNTGLHDMQIAVHAAHPCGVDAGHTYATRTRARHTFALLGRRLGSSYIYTLSIY